MLSLYISAFDQGLYCEEYIQELELTGMGRRIISYQFLVNGYMLPKVHMYSPQGVETDL